MKKQITLLLFIMMSTAIFNSVIAKNVKSVQIEENSQKEGKYAILVQSPMHFMASVMTGEDYKKKNSKIQFEIILIGEVVKDIAINDNLLPFIENAKKLDIKIIACEFAMQKLGISKSDYASSIQTTSNGFSYIFNLQELGFKTITL